MALADAGHRLVFVDSSCGKHKGPYFKYSSMAGRRFALGQFIRKHEGQIIVDGQPVQ